MTLSRLQAPARTTSSVVPRVCVATLMRAGKPSSVVMLTDRDKQAEPPSGLNIGLLITLLANQAFLAVPVYSSGGFEAVKASGHFLDPTTWALGLAAALPLMGVGFLVEKAKTDAVIEINWSTDLLVLRLFGLATQPALAAAVCVLLGASVGLVEETAFRGQVLPIVQGWVSKLGVGPDAASVVAIACSGLAFGALHLNPRELPQIKENPGTQLTLGLQTFTGLWLAWLTVSTGNLGAAIIAHGVYDAWTIYSTHLEVTQQYAYARALSAEDVRSSPVAMRWAIARGEDFVRDVTYLFHFLDRNRGGTVDEYELKTGLFAYGFPVVGGQSSEELGDVLTIARRGRGLDLAGFIDFVASFGDRLAKRNSLRDPDATGTERKGFLGVRPYQ